MGSSFSELDPSRTPEPATADRGGWALGLLLVATFGIRAIHPGQPIVENYVGRQIPTAMVARNLERGSGFFRPELDTGPFPNLFLVEPPIYAQVVASVRPILGSDREATGRLVSAAATSLGAWGLFGLAFRREGRIVALLAVGSFGLFPVMIRYGRAFQPDALMLGFVLAGLRSWDEFEAGGRARWAVLGGFVLATGLALKVTSAWILIPYCLMVRRWPIAWRLGASLAMLGPAFAWYLYAWGEVTPSGSQASSDNAAIWIRSVDPMAWVRFATWSSIVSGLMVRSFTPLGFVLATLGSFRRPRLDRIWVGWGVGCGLTILMLAAKWHHAYYWMMVAPLAAIGMGRTLALMGDRGRSGKIGAVVLGSFYLALSVAQTASTWRTPREWAGVVEAAKEIQALVPEKARLIAPEALIYLSDRRGFRLEFDPNAARRAAGEWGERLPDPDRPLSLVEFYRTRAWEMNLPSFGQATRMVDAFYPAAVYLADVGAVPYDDRRRAWREAIRGRPRTPILVDRPDLLIARLNEPNSLPE